VVVGAGFAGMYALYRLRELGLRVRAFETGDGVGGTWYWNCYPGARVDVQSLSYSYSFSPELQQDWCWPETFSSQPELLKYANHVADRFDLRRDIRFETTVNGAEYIESVNRWRITTDRGDCVLTRYLVTAAGCLSATNVPDFKGIESFEGQWYHTSRWPKEGVDLAGKRVGIIGTGSTGIQAVPVIAEEASHLYVFQRTPNYSLPTGNRPMDPAYEQEWKANYDVHRELDRSSYAARHVPAPDRSALEASPEERDEAYEAAWGEGAFAMMLTFKDLRTSREANETAAEFVRGKIRAIVKDPEVAELLCPKDYPLGTKRLCLDSDYFETFNRDNVTLVDVKTHPIEEITPTGLRTAKESYDLDVLVFATGFDAMTGPLLRMNITGRGGLSLKEKWEHGPRTYLGLSTAGFPNMFMITGPGSPSVLASMITAIEQHVDWIAGAIVHAAETGREVMEASPEAEDQWVDHVNEVADQTLYRFANSWYLGANIPGKPRVFMPYVGGFNVYRDKCDQVAAAGYPGFVLT
ncbi:MAG TPA: NAD(P)/FAD-dependent oxidoreductase, partial [Acidimicrobiales bacterium]|nr:NAD(P)/FAD-dependent oxidoreductase [Acidimicrobiales bacterium]